MRSADPIKHVSLQRNVGVDGTRAGLSCKTETRINVLFHTIIAIAVAECAIRNSATDSSTASGFLTSTNPTGPGLWSIHKQEPLCLFDGDGPGLGLRLILERTQTDQVVIYIALLLPI